MNAQTYKKFIAKNMHKVIRPNDVPKGLRLYKLTLPTECHNNFQYQYGLNVDVIPFFPNGECNEGGMYFYDEYQLVLWQQFSPYCTNIREVYLPGNARVYVEYGKYKTDRFILGKRKEWKGDPQNYIDLTRCDDIKIVMSYNVYYAKYVPESMMTLKMYRKVIRKYPYMLWSAPQDIIDSLYQEAIKIRPDLISTSCDSNLTYEICLFSVQNGCELMHVPDRYIDERMCDEYIRFPREFHDTQHVTESSIKKIPKNLFTEDRCRMMLKNRFSERLIPKNMRTRELYEYGIRECGMLLRDVPYSMRDEEMYLLAVKADGLSILSVPKHLLTKEICLEAVKNNPLCIEDVPEDIVDAEMYKCSVREPSVLAHFPLEYRTVEIVEEALKNLTCQEKHSYISFICAYTYDDVQKHLLNKYL